MKIWAISDTHGTHRKLLVPPDIDMIIHSGDFTNWRDTVKNSIEAYDFLEWLMVLNVKYKILVAGNHDTSLYSGLVKMKNYPEIIYLDHKLVEIEGIKIFGSPYTPSFGVGWAFNKDRGKIDKYWQQIPEGADIVVTHGPPQRILDLAVDYEGVLEYCGCRSLARHIDRVKPKVSIFGHIHNGDGYTNQGVLIRNGVYYMNASCVTDNKFDLGPTSNGHVFELKDGKVIYEESSNRF